MPMSEYNQWNSKNLQLIKRWMGMLRRLNFIGSALLDHKVLTSGGLVVYWNSLQNANSKEGPIWIPLSSF